MDCQAGNNDGKYGNGTNEIEQFFRGILTIYPTSQLIRKCLNVLKMVSQATIVIGVDLKIGNKINY
ncbi:hypothetical protein [Borrelia hermsii]|uniref:hypothetical protein n=1 Tax=Borrelia hermsii TaxID=140 RepID=UPI0030B8212C